MEKELRISKIQIQCKMKKSSSPFSNSIMRKDTRLTLIVQENYDDDDDENLIQEWVSFLILYCVLINIILVNYIVSSRAYTFPFGLKGKYLHFFQCMFFRLFHSSISVTVDQDVQMTNDSSIVNPFTSPTSKSKLIDQGNLRVLFGKS